MSDLRQKSQRQAEMREKKMNKENELSGIELKGNNNTKKGARGKTTSVPVQNQTSRSSESRENNSNNNNEGNINDETLSHPLSILRKQGRPEMGGALPMASSSDENKPLATQELKDEDTPVDYSPDNINIKETSQENFMELHESQTELEASQQVEIYERDVEEISEFFRDMESMSMSTKQFYDLKDAINPELQETFTYKYPEPNKDTPDNTVRRDRKKNPKQNTPHQWHKYGNDAIFKDKDKINTMFHDSERNHRAMTHILAGFASFKTVKNKFDAEEFLDRAYNYLDELTTENDFDRDTTIHMLGTLVLTFAPQEKFQLETLTLAETWALIVKQVKLWHPLRVFELESIIYTTVQSMIIIAKKTLLEEVRKRGLIDDETTRHLRISGYAIPELSEILNRTIIQEWNYTSMKQAFTVAGKIKLNYTSLFTALIHLRLCCSTHLFCNNI